MSKSAARVGGIELALVAALLLLGAGLRFWRLDLGWFGVDQARDIQTALDIAAGGDWPMVGPTMRRVTSLGALYYFFWALPHLLSRDPLAAYGFAAGLGIVTLVLTWGLARRCWGSRAALVALATLATSQVAVIDARVAWAPAALPAAAVVLLWLLVGPAAWWRLAALGAVLGLAIQLHLTMIAWGLAAALLVMGRRPHWRSLVAGGLGFAVTGWPAVYAALGNAGRDAGIATLPSRGPWPDVLGRIEAALALGWRVPAAFRYGDAPAAWQLLVWTAAALIAVVGALGIVRLAVGAWRGDRAARVLVVVLAGQLGMVALLPGEAWYYYLDAALPLWALAAGALVAPSARRTVAGSGERALSFVAAIVLVAALLQGAAGARWLGESAQHGYLMLSPAALTLDGGGGRDAAVPGRLVTVGVKRALAAVLATEPTSFSTRWLATHGPAFDDATGDNGFWLLRATSSGAVPSASVTHAGLWYRDDPEAPVTPVPGFELVAVGPLVVARYRPTIVYDACRDEHGPVVVPVRVVPHPRRYGDGTVSRPATLPHRIDCAVAAGVGATRVVAAVTAGTVTLRDGAGVGGSMGPTGPTGPTSTLCVRRGEQPAAFAIEIALPAGTASDLDLYERPDPDCAAPKIAP